MAEQSVLPEIVSKVDLGEEVDLDDLFPKAEPVYPIGTETAPITISGQAGINPDLMVPLTTVERPDPLPFLNQPNPPSDADRDDAMARLKPYSGLSEEEADQHIATLQAYDENQRTTAANRKKEAVIDIYRNPNALADLAKDPAIRQEMDLALDDELVQQRAANRNFLSTIYDKPNATPEELDALMREYSIKRWGINNPSHATFFSKTVEDVKKMDEERLVLDDVNKAVVGDLAKEMQPGAPKTSSVERFEKIAKAHSKTIDTPEKRDRLAQHMLLVEDQIRRLKPTVRNAFSQLVDLGSRIQAGTDTELDYNRTINLMRGVPKAELEQIFKLGALMYRDEDPKGDMMATIAENMSKRFGRDHTLRNSDLADSRRTLSELKKKAETGNLKIGEDAQGKPYYAMDGRPLPAWATEVQDPQKYAAYVKDIEWELEGIRALQTMQNFQHEVVDPVKPFWEGGFMGKVEAGVYDVAGMSKILPLGLVRGGVITMAKIIGDKHYLDITYQNPNLDSTTASQMSSLMGLAESLSMQFKANIVIGSVATFKSMRTLSSAGKSLEALKVFAKWNGVTQFAENFEEFAQDTTSAVIKKLYADANPSTMKQQDWNALVAEIASSRLDVAFAVAPLALIGAGSATVRDLRNPMRDFMNANALKMQGLHDDQIAEILATGDLDKAEKVFRKHMNARTEEDVRAGFMHAMNNLAGEQASANASMADPVLPKLEPTAMPDGTYKYTLYDEKGKVMSTFTDPDTAEMAWIRETERVQNEIKAQQQEEANQQAQAEAEAAQTDEGIAKEAEAKATAETVSPEDRLGTAVSVEFEQNVNPTPAESREVAQLQAEVRAEGRADTIILARPSGRQTGSGAATLNFVRAFEAATGKRVVFVATGTDQPLSFTGVVRSGDSDTIFLDAHGNRNVLALLGHEWSHTLEKTNPQLHAAMITQMKPFIVDWAKQAGLLKAELGLDDVTNEMVANIVGDAIANEGFWEGMAKKNPRLFQSIVEAVLEFFDQFINRVRYSEFGTEAFTDAQKMREIVADVMDRATREGPEAVEAEAATTGVSFASSRPFKVYIQVDEEFYRTQRPEIEGTDQKNRDLLDRAIADYRRAALRTGLAGDQRAGQERSRKLGGYVAPSGYRRETYEEAPPGPKRYYVDQRIVSLYGSRHLYDRLGLPYPTFPTDTPATLLVKTDQKPTAVISDELAETLGIPRGEVPRQVLRDAIVKHFISKGNASLGRKAFLSGGGGGSGKTTLMKKEGMGEKDPGRVGYVHIDADEIRKFLPEYQALLDRNDPRAADITHEESSTISKRLFAEAMAKDLPILYDATMANPKKAIAQLIDPLKAKGYSIRMMGVIIDPYEALVRAFVRAHGSKRFVPPFNLLEAHAGWEAAVAEGVYEAALGKENVVIYDNTAQVKPEPKVQFAPRGTFPKPVVDPDAVSKGALSADRQLKYGKARDLPAGTPVGVRIDIPAYMRTSNQGENPELGVYVQTIHEPKKGGTRVKGAGQVGDVIGYDSMVAIDDPVFWANEKGAQAVFEGRSDKFPMATVEGEFNPSRELPSDLVMGWAPVGFNPRKHSYFYDKENGELVASGEKAISIGNTVYVKNPVYGDKSKALFAGRRKVEPPTQHHADIVAAHDASVAAMNGEGGGSTVNAVHGSLVGTKNFSVAVFPELSTQIPGKKVTAEQIAELAAKAKAMKVDTTGERISIGTWYDKENDTTWLDVVMTTADRERALDLAKQYNQKAIFDLENVEEITTGGTGEMVGGLPPIKDRIEAINNPTRFALAELEQFAKDNEDFKNWYDEFSRFLDDLLKEFPEYKPIVSEFLAATSANTPLKKNVESTIENLRSFILEGKFVTKFEAHLPNLGRATRGEKLQGPKIGEFSGAVFGDVNSIAIDTHMAQIIFGARRNAKGQIIGPTDAQIRVGKEVVRQIARRLGWTPAQAQAALWAANLKLTGKYDPNYRYERYLEEHRQELLDILAQDRSGEGRGREASRRIGERIRQGEGAEGGISPELVGEAQPRADTAAQEAISGGPQEVQQELGQLAPSKKEVSITVFDRKTRAFAQRNMVASQDLLNELRDEVNIYERLLACLS